MYSVASLNKLEEHVKQGLLRKAEDNDLVQYNYSEMCNNQYLWDDITKFNRGNIYEKKTGNLVAKSFPKFMNFEQLPEEEQKYFLSKDKLTITDKKDGCLGILYMYNDEIRCNSRGGFDNYVTDTIKKLLPKYIMIKTILKHNVIVVEVISPATKILCDYGTEEELFLLTAYNNETWEEHPIEVVNLMSQVTHIPRPATVTMSWEELFNWQKQATWQKEGFVVAIEDREYGSYKRVKVKSADYLRVAKVKACLNKHKLWKLMRDDIFDNTNTLEEYLSGIPDELYDMALEIKTELVNELEQERTQVENLVEKLSIINTRGLSSYFKENPSKYMGAVFNHRNGKSYDRMLIKLIEPKETICSQD